MSCVAASELLSVAVLVSIVASGAAATLTILLCAFIYVLFLTALACKHFS